MSMWVSPRTCVSNTLLLSPDATGNSVAFVRYDVQTDIFLGDVSPDHQLLRPPSRFTLTDRNERRPAWGGDSRGIFFSSDQSGNYDIFYQDLDAASPVAVAASSAWETSPVVDPEGKHLLFFRLPAAGPDEETTLDLVSQTLPPGEGESRLVSDKTHGAAAAGRPPPWDERLRCARGPGRGCVLSKTSGKSIVWNRLDPTAGVGEEVYREVHAALGSGIWDISPDGSLLAVPTPIGPVRILSIGGDRSPPRQLAMPDGCDPFLISWAADQQGLFVTCEFNADDDAFRLFFVPLQGAPRLVWQSPPNYILESEPSPDGKHIAIAVKRPDDDVWVATGFDR